MKYSSCRPAEIKLSRIEKKSGQAAGDVSAWAGGPTKSIEKHGRFSQRLKEAPYSLQVKRFRGACFDTAETEDTFRSVYALSRIIGHVYVHRTCFLHFPQEMHFPDHFDPQEKNSRRALKKDGNRADVFAERPIVARSAKARAMPRKHSRGHCR